MTSPAAAEVLRVSAFLGAGCDSVRDFSKGATVLGASIVDALAESDELAVTELLRPLARYSLVRLDPKAHAFGLHRLVQEIVASSLTESERRQPRPARRPRSRQRISRRGRVRELGRVRPARAARDRDRGLDRSVRFGLRGRCAHALALGGIFLATGPVCRGRAGARAGTARYRERALGVDHPDVAESLNGLAAVCNEQGR